MTLRSTVPALIALLSLQAAGLTLHVSPTGDDAWSGLAAVPDPASGDGPLASLAGARDAIRRHKAAGAAMGAVTVLIAGGTYPLTGPVTFSPADSGSPAAPIVYRAAPGAKPVFSGGMAVTGFAENPDGSWSTRIHPPTDEPWRFEQLWINGRRATRARTPNRFFHYLLDVDEEVLEQGAPGRPKQARQTLSVRPADVASLENLSPAELAAVQVVAYHKWDNTRRFLDAADTRAGTLVISGGGMKPWNPLARDSGYILENYRAALDEAGEWFLDTDGTLSYLPLPGESPATTTAIAPLAETFLVFEGDPAAGAFVEHLAFHGLAFRHAQWLTPPEGFEAAQAASPIGAVILADGARHLSFTSCEIGHIGTYAVWFRKGCRDITIRQSLIHDLGAGGIRIGETSIPPTAAEQTSHITVDNNIIRHGGRIFPCAVGIWIGHASDNTITHNDISDLFYSAISIGWRWGYDQSAAARNQVHFNRLHHLGWGLLSDMGGVYTLGPSPGTSVSNNVIHDIHSWSYGGWGLYNDEGSTGVLMENNLVYNTRSGGYHQHYGRDNIIRNNIFANATDQQLQFTRVEDHRSFTFSHNIIHFSGGRLLHGPWAEANIAMDHNLYFHTSGETPAFAGKDFDQWRATTGHDTHSLVADPRFIDPAAHDYRLLADSPALALGFVPFDPSLAGVRGDPQWVATAAAVEYPPLEFPPPPPPLEIHDDFETRPPGSPPRFATLSVENRGDAIAVSDATAASGRHSLRITDAPGLQRRFNPFLYYAPAYHSGTARCAFDLHLEADSSFSHEWRDSASPYLAGPSLSIDKGTLQLPDGHTLPLPPGQWIRFEIETTLGPDATGTWSLTVTTPDSQTHRFPRLPFRNADWRSLTWLGFISNADRETSFHLDNLQLSN